ncbi:uncharacterized protein [Dysidea avara]|uniref:uncharacterized protein isoform X2 n=1 Tax=Dysidea avara TaxID=196820 RepID=UPI00332EC059
MATETEPKAYGVAMDNYEQLVNTIPVEEVLRKLLTKRVINLSDKQIIMSGKSDVNRAECLLDNHIMKQLSVGQDRPFLDLLDAMRESGKCDDLVKKIYQKLGMEMPQSMQQRGDIDHGDTSSFQGDSYEIIEEVLSNKRVFLTQNLSSNDLVDYLVQERMIDDSIHQKLGMPCFTPMEKNRWIIDSLVTGPPNTFKRFCAILRKVKKYNYIAEELERERASVISRHPH